MFNKIYLTAYEATKENIKLHSQKEEEKAQYLASTTNEERVRDESTKALWKVQKGVPSRNEVISTELFDIITKHNFEVLEYAKRVDEIDYYEEYDPVIEYYSLKYKNYKFIAKNLTDVDIPEGIFTVYKAENIITGEEIKYYVDLGCRNTGEGKLKAFLQLLESSSREDFLNKKYHAFLRIPALLEIAGYNVEENIEYDLDNIKGYLKIENKVNVIPYINAFGETRLVISNTTRWDMNSSNTSSKIAYYVDYKKEDDIELLIKNIEAFKKHINGQYGYFENNRYYTNKDVENMVMISRLDADGNYLPCFNHYHIKLEKVREWDGRGYYDFPYINVYKGLELAFHFSITFNDAAQWSIGNIINTSDIVLKYDKNIDKDNCILMIRNYKYTSDDDRTYYNPDAEDGYYMAPIDNYSTEYNPEFLVDEVEFKASFTECLKTLREYLNRMCEINMLEKMF